MWRKANPRFGITIDADQFTEDCRDAQESPMEENSFLRYPLRHIADTGY
jgi:phage terminase large subunit-like protein